MAKNDALLNDEYENILDDSPAGEDLLRRRKTPKVPVNRLLNDGPDLAPENGGIRTTDPSKNPQFRPDYNPLTGQARQSVPIRNAAGKTTGEFFGGNSLFRPGVQQVERARDQINVAQGAYGNQSPESIDMAGQRMTGQGLYRSDNPNSEARYMDEGTNELNRRMGATQTGLFKLSDPSHVVRATENGSYPTVVDTETQKALGMRNKLSSATGGEAINRQDIVRKEKPEQRLKREESIDYMNRQRAAGRKISYDEASMELQNKQMAKKRDDDKLQHDIEMNSLLRGQKKADIEATTARTNYFMEAAKAMAKTGAMTESQAGFHHARNLLMSPEAKDRAAGASMYARLITANSRNNVAAQLVGKVKTDQLASAVKAVETLQEQRFKLSQGLTENDKYGGPAKNATVTAEQIAAIDKQLEAARATQIAVQNDIENWIGTMKQAEAMDPMGGYFGQGAAPGQDAAAGPGMPGEGRGLMRPPANPNSAPSNGGGSQSQALNGGGAAAAVYEQRAAAQRPTVADALNNHSLLSESAEYVDHLGRTLKWVKDSNPPRFILAGQSDSKSKSKSKS